MPHIIVWLCLLLVAGYTRAEILFLSQHRMAVQGSTALAMAPWAASCAACCLLQHACGLMLARAASPVPQSFDLLLASSAAVSRLATWQPHLRAVGRSGEPAAAFHGAGGLHAWAARGMCRLAC